MTYNHLAGRWEPLIEKFFVILEFKQILESTNKENKIFYNLEFNAYDPESPNINVNLSDMNVFI